MAGGVYKRGKSWQAVIRTRGHETVCNTFDTEREARVWYSKTKTEMKAGLYVSRKEEERTTLLDALARYEKEVVPTKRGQAQELSRIRIWSRWPQAARFMSNLHSKDFAEYRDSRLQEVSGNTVRHEFALMSHLYTIAIKEWGMVSLTNPVTKIRMPKLPKGRDRRLHVGELERILKATQSPLLVDIVRFALETATREAEIAGMIWENVNLKKKTATLVGTKSAKYKDGEKRTIPLSPEAARILSALPRKIDGGEVWGITSHAISVAWRRAVSRARKVYEAECKEKKKKSDPAFLIDLTFHDLRHEATSRFFENGLNPMQVAAITGHKTLQMLKRYTHLKAEDLAELLK